MTGTDGPSAPRCGREGAIAGRTHGLDVCNFGYAGAARGELVSAEHVASIPEAAVISVSHGTNCWTRVPFSAALMRETTTAFLNIVRQGHPDVPMVVASPVLRHRVLTNFHAEAEGVDSRAVIAQLLRDQRA